MPPKRKWNTGNKFAERNHNTLEKQKTPEIGNDLLKKIKEGGITTLTKEESHVFWRSLHENFVAHLHSLVPDDPDIEPKGKEDSIEFLNVIFSLLHQLLEEREPNVENFASQIFIVLIGLLKNDCIDEEIKLQIVKISEEWCRRKLLLHNSAIVNTFEFLLEISLKKEATKADVRRACGLRSAVKLENNIPKNRQHFLDAMRNVNYLTTKEGCRFLTLILTLEEELAKEMHTVCKSFLLECTRNIAKAYGEIYYAAWSMSDVAMRRVIEENLIQDFMERILKLKRQALEMSQLGQKVLTLLHAFHAHKSVTHVRAMLASLYEPLLWRNLKSPDTTIRSNAAEVFLDAYPLEKRGEGREKNVEYTEKQHKIMTELLTDKCHIVRIIAVRHICQIASDFWQAIPPEVIQQWLTLVVTQLSRDASCAEVRRSVFRGMRALVVNPLCAEYMQKVLPYLQDSIHDTNARVRTAFVEMLVACKNASSIKFWSIVPLNHLLARLEVDDREVGQKIVKLLFESFYPYERGPEVTLKRIMNMIVLSPIGSRKFFFYSKSVLSFDSCVQLVLSIMTYIFRHVKAELAGKFTISTATEQEKSLETSAAVKTPAATKTLAATKRKLTAKVQKEKKTAKKRKLSSPCSTLNLETSDSRETEETMDETELYFKTSLENPLISEIFIDIVSILLTVHNPKQHDVQYKEQWKKIYSMCKMCIPGFLRYYKGTRTYNSVLYLSSMMPRSVRKSIRPIFHLDSTCLSQLKSLPVDSTDEEVLRLVTILCAWNRGDELLEMTKNWIDEALRAEDLNSTRYGEPRSERRKVKILEAREPNPLLGFRVLNAIFTYPPNNLTIMSKHYGQIVDIWKYLERVKKLIESRVERTSFFDNCLLSDEFIIECFSRYLKLIPNLKLGSENQSFDSVAALTNILDWSEKVLVSSLPNEFPLTNDDTEVEWVVIDTLGPVLVSLLKEVLKAAANFIILSQTSVELTFKIVRLSKLLLHSGCRVMFVYYVCGVMSAISDQYKKRLKGKNLALLYSSMASLLADCVESFTDLAFTKDGLKHHVVNFSEARTSMMNALLTVSKIFGTSSTVFCKTLSRLLSAITVIMKKDSGLLENIVALKKVQDLPYVASLLMTSFYNNKSLSEVAFQALVKSISGEYQEDPKQLLAALGLLLLFIRYRRFISIECLKNALASSESAIVSFHAQMSKEETSEDEEILLEMMVDVLKEARTELTTPRKDMEEEAVQSENAGVKECKESQTPHDANSGKSSDLITKPRRGRRKVTTQTNLRKVTEEGAVESEKAERNKCEESGSPNNNKSERISNSVSKTRSGIKKESEIANQRKDREEAVESEDEEAEVYQESETPRNAKKRKSCNSVTKSSRGRANPGKDTEEAVVDCDDAGGQECEESQSPHNNKKQESSDSVSKSRIGRRKESEINNLRKDTEEAVDSEDAGTKEYQESETPRNTKSHKSSNCVMNSSSVRNNVAETTNLSKDTEEAAVESGNAGGQECEESETPNNNKKQKTGDSVSKTRSGRRNVAKITNLGKDTQEFVESEDTGAKEHQELQTPRNTKSHKNCKNATNSSNGRNNQAETTSIGTDSEEAAAISGNAGQACGESETPHYNKKCTSSGSVSKTRSGRRKVAEGTNVRKDVEETVESENAGANEYQELETPRNTKSHKNCKNITKTGSGRKHVTENMHLEKSTEVEAVEFDDAGEQECEKLNSPYTDKHSDSIIKSSKRKEMVTGSSVSFLRFVKSALESEGAGGKEYGESKTPHNDKNCQTSNSVSKLSIGKRKIAEITNLRKNIVAAAVETDDAKQKELEDSETPHNKKNHKNCNGVIKSNIRKRKVVEPTNIRKGTEASIVSDAARGKKYEVLDGTPKMISRNSFLSGRRRLSELTNLRKDLIEAVKPDKVVGKECEESGTLHKNKSKKSFDSVIIPSKRRRL